MIKKESVEDILKFLEEKANNLAFSEFKTLIIVGRTNEDYKKEELLYFNNANTFVLFYLIDKDKTKIFMNDSWIFATGLNYKKYVRKINKIIANQN